MSSPTCRKPGCHIALPELPSEVGFVFICPGRYEEKAGKPCAGQTGVMLESALPLLHKGMPRVFTSSERLNYLITNAWSQVEYKAKTGRSVPTESEVLLLENVEGLYHEIKSLRYIVACGNLAMLQSISVSKSSNLKRPSQGFRIHPVKLWVVRPMRTYPFALTSGLPLSSGSSNSELHVNHDEAR